MPKPKTPVGTGGDVQYAGKVAKGQAMRAWAEKKRAAKSSPKPEAKSDYPRMRDRAAKRYEVAQKGMKLKQRSAERKAQVRAMVESPKGVSGTSRLLRVLRGAGKAAGKAGTLGLITGAISHGLERRAQERRKVRGPAMEI